MALIAFILILAAAGSTGYWCYQNYIRRYRALQAQWHTLGTALQQQAADTQNPLLQQALAQQQTDDLLGLQHSMQQMADDHLNTLWQQYFTAIKQYNADIQRFPDIAIAGALGHEPFIVE